MTMAVGRGIADITGEAAECGMLGYGKADQRTTGIHLRLRARAFVFATGTDGDTERVLLVVAELPLPMQSVTDEVLARLEQAFGPRYTARNTLITTTHTHAGPGGYCGHLLYNLTTSGFRPATFEAIVAGIVESVQRADADLAPAEVMLSHGQLSDASTNRSPSAFARNPESDRAVFPAGIDPQTTLLRIDRDGRPVAAVNFFATHGTSMTNRNTLISGDNKGYAAYHWERLIEGVDYLADQPERSPGFIAAFAQTNPGDMSPNINRRNGIGPTQDEIENTRIIGLRQYRAAAAQLADGSPIGETVDARMVYVNMSKASVGTEFSPDHREHRTGRPMVAAAALAGTDDGIGFRGFHQGRNPVWDTASSALYRVSPKLRDQHAPKGLVAPGSLFNRITPFVQERVPVQLIRIGRLYLIGIPGEPTIVSGLRLRRVVAAVVGAELADVLCVGYSNAYIHYITTPEEYLEQRYEGGSTLFGRWQLPMLEQTVGGLATAMRDGLPVAPGGRPAAATRTSWLRNARPDTGEFGRVLTEPHPVYAAEQTVRAVFESAYPNNDLHRGSTYLEVQQHRDDAGWVRVADDGDWATTFRWQRRGRAGSLATVEWAIPNDAAPGRYRIIHHGTARRADGTSLPFSGATRAFTVGDAAAEPNRQ